MHREKYFPKTGLNPLFGLCSVFWRPFFAASSKFLNPPPFLLALGISREEPVVSMSSDNLPETSTNDDPGTVEPQAPQEIEEVGESKSAFKPRRLLRGEITYEDAKENKTNIVHQLGYRTEKIRFYTHLYRKQESIKATVACHLGLRTTDQCSVVGVEDWIHGCFNVCIRVDVNDGRQVMFRCPLPYKIGEAFCPGNAEEKLRCEVGTYAWLQQNCSEIPIPHLYGFGFATGKRVSQT